jgi:hypothetical protein
MSIFTAPDHATAMGALPQRGTFSCPVIIVTDGMFPAWHHHGFPMASRYPVLVMVCAFPGRK